MPMKNLAMAFAEELKDVHSAEKQLTRALKKMSKAATNEQLKAAFEEHEKQTQEQIKRLEKVFASIDRKPSSQRCEGIAGIVEEAESHMSEDAAPDVMDAMLIEAAQKSEHYEIASYGTLCSWAKMLHNDEALELLQQTLAEEKQTDERLTQLAEEVVNREALEGQ